MTLASAYIAKISSLKQTIEPQEGRSTIGGISLTLLDYDGEVTALIGADSENWHRSAVTVKTGFPGLDYGDYVTIINGWVTGLKRSTDGTAWEITITDVAKWMQRDIFRGAETTPVTIQGNPMNILMAVITSTGAGTNGSYDWYAETDGLGINDDYVNVSHIEEIRDEWFPGASHYMQFTFSERMKAKDFIEEEICKPLNLYPVINGSGKFDIIPFKPPWSESGLETLDSDSIIGIPDFNANFEGMVNEVEFHFDYDPDDDEYDSQLFYVDSTSMNARGPGKEPIVIKSKGLNSANVGTEIFELRKRSIFNRYATPPPKVSVEAFFSKWIIEPGDIIKLTHPKVPDLINGTIGLTDELMEVLSRTIDVDRGLVKFDLLYTGFTTSNFGKISPSGTVTSGASATQFDMSSNDCAKFEEGWEVAITDSKGRQRGSDVTITDITGTTVTIDDLGETPQAGDIVNFAVAGNQTSGQTDLYGNITATDYIYG